MSIKIRLLAVLHAALFPLGPRSLPPTSAPIVDLGYSQYQGSVDAGTNTTSFLGMRYAAPPVGELRWAAPQYPQTTSGVQQATTPPNMCYQAPSGTSSLTTPEFESASLSKRASSQSEDCLFLNVYIPGSEVVTTTSGGFPVVVWIHGGGYILGSDGNNYNGTDLIIESNHDVIVVMMQYRLGLFGFLAGQAVKEGGALNAGLLDQNYALQWVQAHIRSFGGDPTRVTIWGESAGAGSVLQHLVAHGGNTQPPLFKAAMTSSTFLPPQYNYNDQIPEVLYKEVVNGTNCGSKSDPLSCLRAADVQTLQTLNQNINLAGFFAQPTFVPVVDGTFIVERPTVTIGKGLLNSEYLLAVTNTHEGTIFVNSTTNLNFTDYITELFPNLGSVQAAGAMMMYEGIENNVEQAVLAFGESIIICPTYFLLEAVGEQGWKAEFAVPPASHGYDVAYYFTSDTSPFITAFSNSFMAVAMYDDPNHRYTAGDITPSWNSWTHGFTEMIFNETSAGVAEVYPSQTDRALLQRCEFWRSVSEYTAQ